MKNNLLQNLFISAFLVLFVSCEKPVYTGGPEEEPPVNAKVLISSEPSGAEIYLNGRNTGFRTPDTLIWLEEKPYNIVLKKELYVDTTFTVMPTVEQVMVYEIDYSKNSRNYGAIFCSSEPEYAHVYLNGEDTEQITACTLEHLIPGLYNVKYTLPEHRADSTETVVSAGRTTNIYLTLEDTSKWVSYRKSNSGNPTDNISAIAVNANSKIFLGSGSDGFITYTNDSQNEWKTFNEGNSMLGNNISEVEVIGNKVWLGSLSGLYLYEQGTFTDYSSNLPNSEVYDVYVKDENHIIVGTSGGAAYYDGNSWTSFTTSNSELSQNLVLAVLIDDDNKLWFGTSGSGLDVYDGTNWNHYGMNNTSALKSNGFSDLTLDKDGNIWIGMLYNNYIGWLGGIVVYSNNTFTQKLIVSQSNNAIFVDSNNNVWGGFTSQLVLMKNTGEMKVYNEHTSGLMGSNIVGISEDPSGNMWFAALNRGITKFKKGNF